MLISSVYNLVFYLLDGIPKFIHSGWSELVLMGISCANNFNFYGPDSHRGAMSRLHGGGMSWYSFPVGMSLFLWTFHEY